MPSSSPNSLMSERPRVCSKSSKNCLISSSFLCPVARYKIYYRGVITRHEKREVEQGERGGEERRNIARPGGYN